MKRSIGCGLRACALLWLLGCGRVVSVGDAAGLEHAIGTAVPGDVILVKDGAYLLDHKVKAWAPGTKDRPITVRAEHAHGARIAVRSVIGFEVTGSWWIFDGLDMRGICASDTDCEHAFHVVGHADHFRLRHSVLADFNAHLKVNSNPAHELPADGVVEDDEFFDTHPRHTGNPVAPVNIDNAVGWVVRGNLIHDFQKDGPGEGSYGAFVKGGSARPIFERNETVCARDRKLADRMVGLSFGAHGMDAALCPPHWDAAVPCDPEVTGGIMRNNVVANCSDDGIYINKGADTKILFNTLAHTGGMTFRYPASSGEARGNLMSGAIRAVDGGRVVENGNLTGIVSARGLKDWVRPGHADERTWVSRRTSLPGPDPDVPDDLCGRTRRGRLDRGAVQVSLGACAR